jgi:phenylpropionate dioxygenase-like ring-hydroxylating dioxygenase large terminal subunit
MFKRDGIPDSGTSAHVLPTPTERTFMLSDEDNQKMCRVGPDRPMGRLLRRHWLPVVEAGRLQAGADPQHVELAGEEFVAWRDEAGRAGLFDLACLHRGASMRLARAEGDGLRCIYHGWKFAVDGAVIETPNVTDLRFAQRLRGRTHPVREAGGLLWAYLGPEADTPAFPAWPWLSLPESQVIVVPHVQECNFVQAIEGLVDSSHLGVLHSNGLRQAGSSDLVFAQKVQSMQNNLAPRLEAEDTPFGFYYAALRDVAGEDATEARVTAFVAPFTVLNPNGDIMSLLVPLGDTRTAFYHVYWSETEALNVEPLRTKHLQFVGLTPDVLTHFGITPETLGQPGTPSPANNFLQDRAAMREGRSFSGLPGLIEEDVAVCVSSGTLRDRTREVLSTADVAIRKLYIALLRAIDEPIPTVDYSKVAGASARLDRATDWRTLIRTKETIAA